MDQRSNPWSKRTTTEQEDIFFHRSLRMPKPTTGGASNANTVRTLTSKFQRKNKTPKLVRNISAIVDTGAQVTTMPVSAVSKMPNAHNHRDAPPGTAVKYKNSELEQSSTLSTSDTTKFRLPRTTVQQPSSAWTRSLRTDTPSHSQRLKRSSRTRRGTTDCNMTAHKDLENGQCPWKPWRI